MSVSGMTGSKRGSLILGVFFAGSEGAL